MFALRFSVPLQCTVLQSQRSDPLAQLPMFVLRSCSVPCAVRGVSNSGSSDTVAIAAVRSAVALLCRHCSCRGVTLILWHSCLCLFALPCVQSALLQTSQQLIL
jgi:hypothetical protein